MSVSFFTFFFSVFIKYVHPECLLTAGGTEELPSRSTQGASPYFLDRFLMMLTILMSEMFTILAVVIAHYEASFL